MAFGNQVEARNQRFEVHLRLGSRQKLGGSYRVIFAMLNTGYCLGYHTRKGKAAKPHMTDRLFTILFYIIILLSALVGYGLILLAHKALGF